MKNNSLPKVLALSKNERKRPSIYHRIVTWWHHYRDGGRAVTEGRYMIIVDFMWSRRCCPIDSETKANSNDDDGRRTRRRRIARSATVTYLLWAGDSRLGAGTSPAAHVYRLASIDLLFPIATTSHTRTAEAYSL